MQKIFPSIGVVLASILITLVPLVSSLYTQKSSYSLYGYSVTAFALAQKNVDVVSAQVNMAVGLINGSVMITNVDNFNNKYLAYPFNITIQNMDWIQAGIMAQTVNQIKVFEPQYYTNRLSLTFPQTIYTSAVAYSGKYAKIILAVSFSNRIQIFENTTSVMNRTVQSPVRVLTLDRTGNFLYYFDSYARFIIDIPRRNVTQSYYSTNQISLTASSKSGYEDITASIQFGGYNLKIWDDYNNIGTYTNAYPQTYAKFTGDSEYLVTLQSTNPKISLWRTNYGDYTRWTIAQSFDLTSGGSYYQIDAENDRIVCMTSSVFTLFTNSGDDAPVGMILGIVFGVIGFILLVGIIAFCCRKRALKKKQEGQYQKVDNQGFNPSPVPSNQGWNNNTNNNQGWSNQPNNQGWGNNSGAAPNNNQGWFGQPSNNNSNKNSNPYGSI